MSNTYRLENVLKPEHVAAGMYLLEDEDTIELYQDGCLLQVFSWRTTPDMICAEADKYLEVG